MGFYDNSLNSFQGVQADSLLVNRSSSNESSDLTVKQPMPNLGDIQTADSSASAIDSAVGSSQSTTKMTPSIGAMIKFFSTLPNVNEAETAGSTPNQDGSQAYLKYVVDQLVQANNPSAGTAGITQNQNTPQTYLQQVVDQLVQANNPSAGTAGSAPNQDDSQAYLKYVVDQLVQANNPSVTAIESPEKAESGEEHAEEAENTDKNEEIS